MSCKWPIQKLGDLCREITVGFVGTMTSEYVAEGIPFFRSKNISAYQINWDDIKYVSSDFHQKLKKSSLSSGDVAIVRTGKPGTCCVIPDDVTTANCSDIVIVRVDESKLCPHYLSFFMNSLANHQVSSRLVGAVQQHFNVGAAKQIEIPLPSKSEQDEIVHILKTISDKISLNALTNQTLEEMAQAIFKSWFVDFDPVKAKMNGEQPVGMDDATAALFPDKLVESELGLIPEGWEVGTVGSVTAAKGGYAFKSKQFVDEGNPVIKIKNITSAGTVTTSGCQCIDGEVAKTASRFKLSDGDLLMAMTGATVGKSGIYVSDGRDGYLNQRVARFESKVDSAQPCWFTYNLINKDSIFEQIVGAAQGSAQPNISSKGIEQVKTVIPTFGLISKYQELAAPLYTKWISNFSENSQLSELRDTLLPKLLSGELSLDQAQELAEVSP